MTRKSVYDSLLKNKRNKIIKEINKIISEEIIAEKNKQNYD
jgi:hypothetical protein